MQAVRISAGRSVFLEGTGFIQFTRIQWPKTISMEEIVFVDVMKDFRGRIHADVCVVGANRPSTAAAARSSPWIGTGQRKETQFSNGNLIPLEFYRRVNMSIFVGNHATN